MAKKEFQAESKKLMDMMINSISVSYTHLDVYKRQGCCGAYPVFQLNISFSADLFLPEGNCFIQPALDVYTRQKKYRQKSS